MDGLFEVGSMRAARAGATQTATMLDECKKRLGLSESLELEMQNGGLNCRAVVQALSRLKLPRFRLEN